MDIFLPKGFEPGIARPRMSHPLRAAQLSVEAGGVYYPVLRRWATGFAVRAGVVPELSGVVDLYDGAEHLSQYLITGKDTANGEIVFVVKRSCGVDYASGPDVEADARSA
ncbi:hypothetical protein [uncultured Sulfitobacter sp.]|uniref:hypothetical protein n=1 Tax=uncultured Sulfitobacter sp. TaxID=191468 RepID=UPI00261DD197|nr:hypothetical protein [uncultured Sulfitobacter sp.]